MYEGLPAKEIVDKWQSMINLLADVFAMPTGLIIRERPQGSEILVASESSEQPFRAGDTLSSDINTFCTPETEICTIGIENNNPTALDSEVNTSGPGNRSDNKANNFNTRIGLPIHCPDGSSFGVICVMHHRALPINESDLKMLNRFKAITELDLRLLDRLQSATDLSLKDDLTGVYNRRGFNVLSQKQFFYGKRSHIKFAFMIADINGLKFINDNYGHKTGDHAIVTMAEALISSFRECDLVARVGGDEFYIALNLNQDDEIANIVARAEDHLKQHPVASGIVTFSWGVSIRHYNKSLTLSLEELIDEADKKLYENKKMNIEKKLKTRSAG